jgi:hypothetical protein
MKKIRMPFVRPTLPVHAYPPVLAEWVLFRRL